MEKQRYGIFKYEQNQKRNHIRNLISETLRPFPLGAKVFNRIQTLRQG